MVGGGYIKLWRKLEGSAVYSDEWLLKLWVACLFKANYQPAWFRGHPIPRGSFGFTFRDFAAELGVSKGKLERGLEKLASELHQVVIVPGHNFSVLTVINYETYQGASDAERDTSGTPVDPPIDPPAGRKRDADRPTEEEFQEVKEVQEGEEKFSLAACAADPPETAKSYPEEFEAFWEAYPHNRDGRKRGKQESFAEWKRSVLATERQTAVAAAKNYAASPSVRDGFTRDPKRFLKGGFWRDFIEAAGATNGNRTSGGVVSDAEYDRFRPRV